MKKTVTKKLSAITALIALSFYQIGISQTNPTAQTLPYSQNFGTGTFTVAPTGMAVWTINSSPASSQSNAESSTANGNATITAATATQTTGDAYGYATSSNGRLYFQTSSNTTNGTNQPVLAITTTGLTNISVAYGIEMISVTARTIGFVLQYRVGTSGSWTDVTGGVYSHNSSDRTNGQVDNFSVTLPTAAENQSVVQLRWAVWRGTQSGNSSGAALDNISVSGTSQVNGYFRSKQNGNWNVLSTWQASPDSATWVNATVIPSYHANSILVKDSVSITASDSIDQVTVSTSGILTYSNVTGSTVYIMNGIGIDLNVLGKYYDAGPNSNVWATGATWQLGSAASLIRNRSTSSDMWRDHYNGTTSTIPSTSNWIVIKNSTDNPSLSTVNSMHYGNLSILNTTGSLWTTSSSSSFTGSTDFPIVTGNLYIGGSGGVSFLNSNTNTSPVKVIGNTTVSSGSTVRNQGTGFELQGNVTMSGTLSTTGSAYILLSGNNAQTMSGSGLSFPYLTINKSIAAETVTLSSPATITGTLTLTNGLIVSDTINLLTFNAGSAVNGVNNDSSFVSGPVKKIGNTPFTFPLGKGNNAQIISITAPVNTTDAFQAEFFNTDPTAIYGSTTASTFNYVSTCQYFKLLRKNGTSNIKPTLSYDLTSCIMYMVPDPRVTSFNGTEWVDLGESNFLYSNFGGTISTATTITQYGAITLGNNTTTPFNPLDTTFQLANAGACGAIFMSEYVQDTLGNCAIELYNPTNSTVNLNHYYISATQNSSISYPPLQYALTGTVAPFHTFVIVNSEAPSSTLRSKANQLIKNFNFNGKNAIMLEYSTNIGVLLDKIGDYTIPFTDSGWVVGTGSTRNHDLVRLKTVNQGNVQWASAQYEWKVYPMDTYTNLGWDSSFCDPKDPDLILSLGNGQTSCGGATSYFQFDVIASSSPISTQFNYCDFHIYYDTAVFGNISNVTAVQGSSFSSYPNPIISASSPTVLDIQFGDMTTAITPGTVIYSPVTLLTISFPIKSCNTSNVYFTDTTSTHSNNYFVISDSIPITGVDSFPNGTYTYYNPHDCNPYQCNPYPCDYDTSCSCYTNTCYQTCYQTCYDSTQNYTTYMDTTGWNVTTMVFHYTNAYYSGGSTIPSLVCPININSVYGTLDPNGALAGTGDIVTINGQGFGNVTGDIYLTDANYGSASLVLDASDYITWTENQVKIKLPSDNLFSNDSLTPGSGPIFISNSCYNQDNSTLTVYYNVDNWHTTFNNKLKTSMVKEPNSTGSYYFRCDTSISHNAQAYTAVKAAIRRWNCVTGVNWNLGPPDSLAANNTADGVCRIYFSNTDSRVNATTGILAITRTHLLPCFSGDIFQSDADVAVRQDLTGYTNGNTWDFVDTTTGTVTPSLNFSFYQVMLHEIGHVFLLNHVNDINDVMFRTSFAGHAIEDIATWPSSDQDAAHNVIDSSSTVYIGSCGYAQITPISNPGCSSLGIETITALVGQLDVFPNPADGDITINYQLNTNAQVNFKLMDYLGREVLTVKSGERTQGANNEKLNIANLASGIYLLVANINGASQTVRIIKP
jgi:hypothetical protein